MRKRRAAGRFDRYVTIQRVTETGDADYGAVSQSPATLKQVWARREYMRGREVFEASQRTGEQFARYEIKFDPDLSLTLKDRILDGSEVWDIKRLEMPDRRDYITVEAAYKTP